MSQNHADHLPQNCLCDLYTIFTSIQSIGLYVQHDCGQVKHCHECPHLMEELAKYAEDAHLQHRRRYRRPVLVVEFGSACSVEYVLVAHRVDDS